MECYNRKQRESGGQRLQGLDASTIANVALAIA